MFFNVDTFRGSRECFWSVQSFWRNYKIPYSYLPTTNRSNLKYRTRMSVHILKNDEISCYEYINISDLKSTQHFNRIGKVFLCVGIIRKNSDFEIPKKFKLRKYLFANEKTSTLFYWFLFCKQKTFLEKSSLCQKRIK